MCGDVGPDCRERVFDAAVPRRRKTACGCRIAQVLLEGLQGGQRAVHPVFRGGLADAQHPDLEAPQDAFVGAAGTDACRTCNQRAGNSSTAQDDQGAVSPTAAGYGGGAVRRRGEARSAW
ncbi:hypothetical protein QFZ57_003115 [Arthrobacter sp. B1I2]|nr:hypothetical protein [Arthrobacter sp. B1I2]